MMKQTLALFIFLLGLLLPSVSTGADVSLNVDGLTVSLQDEPLEMVLEDLAQQAEFDLMILQKRDFAGETITEEFHNLSLEEGVHRLLPPGTTASRKTRRQDRFTRCLSYQNEIQLQDPPIHHSLKATTKTTILNKPDQRQECRWIPFSRIRDDRRKIQREMMKT